MSLFEYQGFGSLSQWGGQIGSAQAQTQMAEIAATGANTISLSPQWFVDTATSSSLTATSARYDSDASLIAGIKNAQALGLTVFLSPHTDGIDGTDAHDINPTDTASFFASYKEQIVHLATIAQQTGVAALSIGNELSDLTGAQFKDQWTDIISAVRAVYSGELTYAASTTEASSVSFWDQLDFIGVNMYPTLTNTTDPTVAELKAAWTEVPVDNYWAAALDNKSPVDFIESLSEQYGKQVMLTEVGYRSVDGATINPGDYQSSGTASEIDQANAYQAFLEVWSAEGGSWLKGVDFWQWNLDGQYRDTGYSVTGKIAQNIVTQYFKGQGTTEGLNLHGSSTNDVIDIGSGADVIHAGLGDDVIRAGAGDDVIVAGPDTISELTTTTVTFTAYGTAVNGEQAKIQVLVNGKPVGAEVTLSSASATGDYQTYTVTFTNPDQITSLDLQITNAVAGRAAFFRGITVNGYTLATSDVTNSSSPDTFKLYAKTIHLDGATHSDIFYGSGSDNDLIEGGKGDDTIDGGAGLDTAVYSGNLADYAIAMNGQSLKVADSVAGRDGTDTLTNVEYLQFADGTITVASLHAAGVTPTPLISSALVSKVDGNAIPDLTVKGASVAGATVTLYDGATAVGTAVAGSNGAFTISLSDLADGVHALTAKATSDGVTSPAATVKTVVVGHASDIVAMLTSLATTPDAVWIVDGANPITVSVAELTATTRDFQHALTAYTLAVHDTAANILAGLDRLENAADVSSITLEGGSVFTMATVGAMQKAIANYDAALGKIAGGYSFEVTIANANGTTLGHYDQSGAMVWQKNTTATADGGLQVRMVYADGHIVQTITDSSGAITKLTTTDVDGSKHLTQYGITGKGFVSQTLDYDASGKVTDTLQYRADGTLFAKLVYGADGSVTTDTFDAAGKLAQHVIAYAGGGSSTALYTGDTLTKLTVIDATGAKHLTQYGITGKDFVSQTLDYDASGKIVDTLQYRADGTLYAKLIYAANGSVTTDTFDAAGKLAQETVAFAGGGSSTALYSAGVLTKLTVLDANGAKHLTQYGITGKGYASQTLDYNASGKIVDTLQYRADGTLYAKLVYAADGSVTTDTFDAAGKLAQETVAFAGGGSSTALYSAGVLTKLTVLDASGAKHLTQYGITGQSYASQTLDYDASGKIVDTVQYRADGTLFGKLVYGSDGSVTSDTYDVRGVLTQEVVKLTSGASSTSYYTNGVQTQLVTVEASGAKHSTQYGITGQLYDSQTLNYDASGKLIDVLQHNLDGTTALTVYAVSSATSTSTAGKTASLAAVASVLHYDIVNANISYTLGGVTADTLNLIGTAAINGTGDAGDNVIHGNAAANTLTGLAGNDTLDGGAGVDTMIGGLGNDTYYVDNVGDKVIEAAGQGIDTVYSKVTFSLAGQYAENLIFTGAGGGDLTGNDLDNTLTGNQSVNVLNGGLGADTMIGGAGADTYYVDNVGDKVIEAVGGGYDQVFSTVSFSMAGQDIEKLTLTGTAAINATGNDLANVIIGNSGANVIAGGLGADTLTGGAGKDIFVFNTALGGGNVDLITDFKIPDDTIQLDSAIFTALAKGGLSDDAFVVGSAARDASDRIIYNKATGALFYDDDGTGAHAAVQFATINAGLALTKADFVIV